MLSYFLYRSSPLFPYNQLNRRILGTDNAIPIVKITKLASVIIVISPPMTVANQPTTTYPNGNKAKEPNISRLATLPNASSVQAPVNSFPK